MLTSKRSGRHLAQVTTEAVCSLLRQLWNTFWGSSVCLETPAFLKLFFTFLKLCGPERKFKRSIIAIKIHTNWDNLLKVSSQWSNPGQEDTPVGPSQVWLFHALGAALHHHKISYCLPLRGHVDDQWHRASRPGKLGCLPL